MQSIDTPDLTSTYDANQAGLEPIITDLDLSNPAERSIFQSVFDTLAGKTGSPPVKFSIVYRGGDRKRATLMRPALDLNRIAYS